MIVFVINKHGKALMPCSTRKARILLKEDKAKIINKTPFTIQLLYGSSGYRQEITLGMDTGSKHIGISAVTDKKELYSSEIELRTNIVDVISTRRENRRTRRKNNSGKEHCIDALCITGKANVERLKYYFYQKQMRKHNRQIHKANFLKDGKRKLNQASYKKLKFLELKKSLLTERRMCVSSHD